MVLVVGRTFVHCPVSRDDRSSKQVCAPIYIVAQMPQHDDDV